MTQIMNIKIYNNNSNKLFTLIDKIIFNNTIKILHNKKRYLSKLREIIFKSSL